MSDRRFIRVLPDSTGKRMLLSHHYELNYDNRTGLIVAGNIVIGNSSGVEATVTRVIETTATAGTLILHLATTAQDADLVFVDNEQLSIGGQVVALADGIGTDMFAQQMSIASHDNSQRGLKVGPEGAAFVRFPESPITFGPYGSVRTAESDLLSSYDFLYHNGEGAWYRTGSIGTITMVSSSRAMLLSNPTTDGSLTRMITNLNHKQHPGVGTTATLAILVGDTGKNNVVRRWGPFDDNNGMFFQMSGSNVYVGRRSSSTGVPVDTLISQSAWSLDTLDGSRTVGNPSDDKLSLDTINMYWFSYKAVGGGSVHYGVFKNGERKVFHEENLVNTLPDSFLQTVSLPLRVEQENEGTSVSTSELRLYGGSVLSEGIFDVKEHSVYAEAHVENVEVTNTPTHLLSIRPKRTVNGFTNRAVLLIRETETLCLSGSTQQPVVILAYNNATLSGSTFSGSVKPFGLTHYSEVDKAGAFHPAWIPTADFFEAARSFVDGVEKLDVTTLMKYEAQRRIGNDAVGNPLSTISFAAKTPITGMTASVSFTIRWLEVVQ
jgi:hypothetical protein